MYKMELPVMDYAANDVARRADVYLDRIDDRFYAGDEYESNWVLPGHGHYYKHCRQPVSLGCLEEPLHPSGAAHVKVVIYRCKRVTCSACFRHSIMRAGMKAAQRVVGFGMYLDSVFGSNSRGVMRHDVVSIDPALHESMRDPAEFKRVMGKAIDVFMYKGDLPDLKSKVRADGLLGAMVVVHPWRFDHEKGTKYWSPHAHLLSYGYITPDRIASARARMDNQVNFMNKSTFTSVSHASFLVQYLLSHCGIRVSREVGKQFHSGQLLSYYGRLANNKFGASAVFARAADARESMEIAVDKAVRGAKNGSVQVQASSQSGELKDFDLAGVVRSYSLTLSVAEFRKAARAGDILDRLYSTNNPAKSISTLKESSKLDAMYLGPDLDEDTVFLLVTVNYGKLGNMGKYRRLVVEFSPDDSVICPHSHVRLKPVLPVDGNVPKELVVDGELHTVKSDDWVYDELEMDEHGFRRF